MIDRHTSDRGAAVGAFVKGDVEEVATMFAADLDDLSYDDLLPSCGPRAWCSAASERNAFPEAQWPRLPHEFFSTPVRGRFKQFGEHHRASEETPASFYPPQCSATGAGDLFVLAFQTVRFEADGAREARSTDRIHGTLPRVQFRHGQIFDST